MRKQHTSCDIHARFTFKTLCFLACFLASINWIGCGVEPQPGGAPCNSHSDCLSRKCALSQKAQDGAIGICTQELVQGQTQCSDATFQSYLSCLRGCQSATDTVQCTQLCYQSLPANCQTCLGVVNQCVMEQGCQLGTTGCCDAQASSCFKMPVQPVAQTPSKPTVACTNYERFRLSHCLSMCPTHDASCPSGCLLNTTSQPCGMCIINYAECMQKSGCQEGDSSCCPQQRRACYGL